MHQTIGILLFKNTATAQLEQHVFTIANHLNSVSCLDYQDISPEQLARVNQIAANKARLSAAYTAARDYFMASINTLKGTMGARRAFGTKYYKMSYQLHLGVAEMPLSLP